jgi:hypothetical protein
MVVSMLFIELAPSLVEQFGRDGVDDVVGVAEQLSTLLERRARLGWCLNGAIDQ